LLVFTEGGEHSLTEIAKLTCLPISAAHRLTTELAAWRLLERTDGGLYRAGLPLRTIGSRNAHPTSVVERAPYVLDDLAAATQRRARLGTMTGLRGSYIEKQPGRRPTTAFSAAATLPAHPTALGRALLAFGPRSTVELAIAQGLRRYTDDTVTAPDRQRRTLAVTRLTGVAVTRREFEPRTCGIAMPVFGPGDDIVAALEDVDRDNTRWLGELVNRQGWPGRSLVGEDGAAAAWLLAQHADQDPTLQRRRPRPDAWEAAASRHGAKPPPTLRPGPCFTY
jgi:DNA-binding IclR family transcriptional regulator